MKAQWTSCSHGLCWLCSCRDLDNSFIAVVLQSRFKTISVDGFTSMFPVLALSLALSIFCSNAAWGGNNDYFSTLWPFALNWQLDLGGAFAPTQLGWPPVTSATLENTTWFEGLLAFIRVIYSVFLYHSVLHSPKLHRQQVIFET